MCNNPILQKEKNQTRDNLKSRFEQEINAIKKSGKKHRKQNLDNVEKIETGHKNKKLVTDFTQKKLDNYKYRATRALKQYKMSKFYTITITNYEFKIDYKPDKYQDQKFLDGKYVIESTVSKEEMTTKEVREKYKELQ